jgi:hypothetical protein
MAKAPKLQLIISKGCAVNLYVVSNPDLKRYIVTAETILKVINCGFPGSQDPFAHSH